MRGDVCAQYADILGDSGSITDTDPDVLFPSSEIAVSDIIRRAGSLGHKLSFIGGGTSPYAPTEAGSVYVSLRTLSSVLEVDAGDRIVRVQAGASLAMVDEAARESGLVIPLDVASRSTATVGGAFLTSAHAFSSLGYGPLDGAVIGLRCITSRGDIVTGGGRTVKNVTGYDIPRFLAGTLGAFAVVTELTFAAKSLPESTVVLSARFSNTLDAVKAGALIHDTVSQVTCIEMAATGGCDDATTLWIAVAGMESLVSDRAESIAAFLHDAGAEAVGTMDYDSFLDKRCSASRAVAVSDMVTLKVPPPAGAEVLDVVRHVAPNAPCTGHPAAGRYHVVVSEEKMMKALARVTVGVGGTEPVMWRTITKDGAGVLFSDEERAIATSLKRELDGADTLNPHIRIL